MSGALSTGKALSRRRLLYAAGGLLAGAAVSCGGNGGGEFPPTPEGSPSPATTTTPSTTETPPVMTELRVAYVNLLSPVSVDANDMTAKETFEQRIAIIIEQLKEFKPDIVGFGEVFKTDVSAQKLLFDGLQMDFQYARANPWFPDQTREQSNDMAELAGYEEGELLMVRPPLVMQVRKRYGLNPRNSESEGRACLGVSIDGPEPLSHLDVYLTHLTSDNERIRQQQSEDMLRWIEQTRGTGPALILGDLNDVPESPLIASLAAAGFADVAKPKDGEAGITTCCREEILGEQPPLTRRTDFILASGLAAAEVSVFADQPKKRADGTLLYASDHNGVRAVFPLPASLPVNSGY